MSILILRSSGAGGGGSGFTPDSGFGSSGTFSDGQSVTITKAAGGFGTKPNGAKPLIYWNPGQDGVTTLNALSRKTTWDVNPTRGTIQQNQLLTGSAHSYEITSFTGGPGVI